MSNLAVAPEPPTPSQRPGAGTLLTVVNGVPASVASVFVGTHSVLITVIAAIVAVALAATVLLLHR